MKIIKTIIRIIKTIIFSLIALFLGNIIGYFSYDFFSIPSNRDAKIEDAEYRRMIYILYNISKSAQEYNSLYEYYEHEYLYSPWIFSTEISYRRVIDQPKYYNLSSIRTLSESDFAKISGFRLVDKTILVNKDNEHMRLKKIPLDKDAPIVFKRLGFSCRFGETSPDCKLRKEYPAIYFQPLEDKK